MISCNIRKKVMVLIDSFKGSMSSWKLEMRKTAECMGTDYAQMEGAGAAGGLGFAFVSYLGARLVPGIDLILDVK